jgi:hypothetical protein
LTPRARADDASLFAAAVASGIEWRCMPKRGPVPRRLSKATCRTHDEAERWRSSRNFLLGRTMGAHNDMQYLVPLTVSDVEHVAERDVTA